MNDTPRDEELNAYVDGELSPRDDANVARAIARDRAVAARVASLSRLKSALAETAEAPAKAIGIPRTDWSPRMLATAASIGLLAALAIFVLSSYLPFGAEDESWFQEASAAHSLWTRDSAAPDAPEVKAGPLLVALRRIELPVHPPELDSARLRLTYLKYFEATESAPAALHFGYTGRRGCQVTLWATAAPQTLTSALLETRDGRLRGYRWRVRNTAYALFATGMAEDRFTTIADKVYEATRENRGFDEETRMALNQASSIAPPCVS
jgi:anti-sigma factor RsiW